jgi:hypothetical protein
MRGLCKRFRLSKDGVNCVDIVDFDLSIFLLDCTEYIKSLYFDPGSVQVTTLYPRSSLPATGHVFISPPYRLQIESHSFNTEFGLCRLNLHLLLNTVAP